MAARSSAGPVSQHKMRRGPSIFFLAALVLVVGGCLGEETAVGGEQESDNKATDSEQVKVKVDPEPPTPADKGKRAPVAQTAVPSSINSVTAQPTTKVMIMPPVSLMIAMPHPSGRFLMLFPTTQLLPLLPMPYAASQQPQPQPQPHQQQHPSSSHLDHPAMFAARHQMLYSNPTYQPPRDTYFPQASSPYHQQPSYSGQGGYKRIPADLN